MQKWPIRFSVILLNCNQGQFFLVSQTKSTPTDLFIIREIIAKRADQIAILKQKLTFWKRNAKDCVALESRGRERGTARIPIWFYLNYSSMFGKFPISNLRSTIHHIVHIRMKKATKECNFEKTWCRFIRFVHYLQQQQQLQYQLKVMHGRWQKRTMHGAEPSNKIDSISSNRQSEEYFLMR